MARSKAWKGLEHSAAAALKGERICRMGNYSQSLPDVRLDYAPHISIDCKHSQNGFTHHKLYEKLARSSKNSTKREDVVLLIPSIKKTNIQTRIAEVERKYGKPAVLISREKGKHLILAAIREQFYQELLTGSKIDDGAYIVVMTLDRLATLILNRYAPNLLDEETLEKFGGNKEVEDEWDEW